LGACAIVGGSLLDNPAPLHESTRCEGKKLRRKRRERRKRRIEGIGVGKR
jgi:hypothetical protein